MKHADFELKKKHFITEALNSRSSKSISYTEEQKASLNKHDFYQSEIFKTYRDLNRKRDAAGNSNSNFSVESAQQICPQMPDSVKHPGKKICLKKYNDIIGEIDNMKMKISRISRDLPVGLIKQ